MTALALLPLLTWTRNLGVRPDLPQGPAVAHALNPGSCLLQHCCRRKLNPGLGSNEAAFATGVSLLEVRMAPLLLRSATLLSQRPSRARQPASRDAVLRAQRRSCDARRLRGALLIALVALRRSAFAFLLRQPSQPDGFAACAF